MAHYNPNKELIHTMEFEQPTFSRGDTDLCGIGHQNIMQISSRVQSVPQMRVTDAADDSDESGDDDDE